MTATLHDLRDELLAIRRERGSLTPAIVVEEATSPDSPLHSRFEWDDSVAARSYRLVQARDLIQSVKVVYKEAKGKAEPRMVRAFHSVPGEDGRAYVPADEVAADPFMRELVLREMEFDFKRMKERYGHFREFADMLRAEVEAA